MSATPELPAILKALEEVSCKLGALDPDDSAGAEPVLRQRAMVIAELASALAARPGPASAETRVRLEHCLTIGAGAMLRMGLARERLRSHLSQLNQQLQLLQALRLGPPMHRTSVDWSG